MLHGLKRTNEHCYICDFQKPVSDKGFTTDSGDKGIESIYSSGLSGEDSRGRYVFIHPRDGKPICNVCHKAAEYTLSDFTSSEPVTWQDNMSELFEKAVYIPADLDNPNIDWEKVKAPYTFPLPVKQNLRQMGYQLCTKYQKYPLTDEHKADTERIRKEKGYTKQEETRRIEYNKRCDTFWQPVPDKPKLAKTSTWPLGYSRYVKSTP